MPRTYLTKAQFKKIAINILIVCAAYAYVRMNNTGARGLVITYGILSTLILLIPSLPTPKFFSERIQRKARNDLLEYKKMLDSGIITQDEFDIKSNELKQKIF